MEKHKKKRMINLYVCTYFTYHDVEEGIEEIESIVVTAPDETMAEEYAIDVIQTKYPDQKFQMDVQMIEKEVYAKIFLMDAFNEEFGNSLN